jgi:outer membrane lipoprotein-sorting protein
LPAAAQDASEVVAKMIDAGGGREAMEAVKDATMTGQMDIIPMGMSGTITMYFKEPNMYRQDMEAMGMVFTQAFDGETAWITNPQTGATEELPGMAQEYAGRSGLEMGNSVLLHPEKYGVTYRVKGREAFEGRDHFVLEQAFESADVNTLYVDAETFLLSKMRTKTMDPMGGTTDQELIFRDYKAVEGLKYAHSLTIHQAGEEFATMTFMEIRINSGLDDALFKMR